MHYIDWLGLIIIIFAFFMSEIQWTVQLPAASFFQNKNNKKP